MASSQKPLDFPVVIRQHLDYLLFSVPDLGISIVQDLPPDGRLNAQFVHEAAKNLARIWLKSTERLAILKSNQIKTPEPSKTKTSILAEKERGLSTREVAKSLGVSENTVRRMVEDGFIRCEKTAGGHRRFYQNDIEQALVKIKETPHLIPSDVDDLPV